jgi:hypothetical protein
MPIPNTEFLNWRNYIHLLHRQKRIIIFSTQQYQQIFKSKANLSKMMKPVHRLQEAQGKMKNKRNKNKISLMKLQRNLHKLTNRQGKTKPKRKRGNNRSSKTRKFLKKFQKKRTSILPLRVDVGLLVKTWWVEGHDRVHTENRKAQELRRAF